jgi:hypothetical protein
MTQGGHEMMVSQERGMLGRPEDGEAFEPGYLRHLSVIGQCKEFPLTYHSELIGGQTIASEATAV